MAATFHPFPRLPFELRDQIWHDALPDDSGPTLYFYRGSGHWRPYRLPESDPGYRPGQDDMGLNFDTDLMDEDNQFQVPLAFVNREARTAALKWVDKQVRTSSINWPYRNSDIALGYRDPAPNRRDLPIRSPLQPQTRRSIRHGGQVGRVIQGADRPNV